MKSLNIPSTSYKTIYTPSQWLRIFLYLLYNFLLYRVTRGYSSQTATLSLQGINVWIRQVGHSSFSVLTHSTSSENPFIANNLRFCYSFCILVVCTVITLVSHLCNSSTVHSFVLFFVQEKVSTDSNMSRLPFL